MLTLLLFAIICVLNRYLKNLKTNFTNKMENGNVILFYLIIIHTQTNNSFYYSIKFELNLSIIFIFLNNMILFIIHFNKYNKF